MWDERNHMFVSLPGYIYSILSFLNSFGSPMMKKNKIILTCCTICIVDARRSFTYSTYNTSIEGA